MSYYNNKGENINKVKSFIANLFLFIFASSYFSMSLSAQLVLLSTYLAKGEVKRVKKEIISLENNKLIFIKQDPKLGVYIYKCRGYECLGFRRYTDFSVTIEEFDRFNSTCLNYTQIILTLFRDNTCLVLVGKTNITPVFFDKKNIIYSKLDI